MKKILLLIVALLISVQVYAAEPLRVYVSEFAVAGVQQNKEDLKAGLQAILSAKLNNEKLTSVDNIRDAEIVVKGTYVIIGKHYSLDVVTKTAAGNVVSRASQQGEGQENLIPAVAILSEKMVAEVIKKADENAIPRLQKVVVLEQPVQQPPRRSGEIIRAGDGGQVRRVPQGDIIRAQRAEKINTSGWLSKRFTGVANLLAVGRNLPSGEREVFIAEERKVTYYRVGDQMKPVVSFELGRNDKVIGLDAIDSDGNGEVELYVTISNVESLKSKVFETSGDRMVKVADDQPYFFRALSMAGGEKKLYVQEFANSNDYEAIFYGAIHEAVKSGKGIKLTNKMKLPENINIMSFNQFKDEEGKLYTVTLNIDGYIIVYDGMKEIWRSNDKFGESEMYFMRPDDPNKVRFTGSFERFIFLTQRIQVTKANEVLVGKNDGFWGKSIAGNSRTYKKGAVYSFAWNSSGLEEVWRTKDTQNYMPDFYYDELKGDLLLLQLVTRPTPLVDPGASVLAIKKVD